MLQLRRAVQAEEQGDQGVAAGHGGELRLRQRRVREEKDVVGAEQRREGGTMLRVLGSVMDPGRNVPNFRRERRETVQ